MERKTILEQKKEEARQKEENKLKEAAERATIKAAERKARQEQEAKDSAVMRSQIHDIYWVEGKRELVLSIWHSICAVIDQEESDVDYERVARVFTAATDYPFDSETEGKGILFTKAEISVKDKKAKIRSTLSAEQRAEWASLLAALHHQYLTNTTFRDDHFLEDDDQDYFAEFIAYSDGFLA